MNELELLDWKRRIFELYAEIRRDPDPEHAWQHWRDTRDELFGTHPQTPIPASASFDGVPYFDYEPALRLLGAVEPAERETRAIATWRGALLVHALRPCAIHAGRRRTVARSLLA